MSALHDRLEQIMGVRKLKCSIWHNGRTGWGIKVLGGMSVRLANFDRSQSPVIVEIDGEDVSVNVDKKSFWNSTCGELIRKLFGKFAEKLASVRPIMSV